MRIKRIIAGIVLASVLCVPLAACRPDTPAENPAKLRS